MSKPVLIRALHVLGAMVILAPTAASSAALASKHAQASAAHLSPRAHPAAHRHERDDQTWMMIPVALAAVSFAIRRQQHALDSLQPQVN
jgi:hypothetical protein